MNNLESSFGAYREEYERKSVRDQVLDAQINLTELFYNRIVSESEAESLAQELAQVKNQQDLEVFKQKIEHEGIGPFQRIEHHEKNAALIETLRESFQQIFSALDSKNWSPLLIEFIRRADMQHASAFQGLLVKGWIARILEKGYYSSRQEGYDAFHFGKEAETTLRDVERLPDFLMGNIHAISGKRQPSFLESIEATLERFALVERLPEVLGEHVDSIIIGGSLSYGPFYNVRKNIDVTGASDIDLICILSDSWKLKSWNELLGTDLLASQDRNQLVKRMECFADFQHKNTADIISQRIRAAKGDFNVSMHFFPSNFFSRMDEQQLSVDLEGNEDVIFPVRDYKFSRFEHETSRQQAFDGTEYDYRPPQVEVQEGVLVTLPGYVIQDKKYYPGLYQNLISPEFSVFYDATGATQDTVGKFQELIRGRLANEKASRKSVSLKKSHIRNLVFAPERYLD